MPKGGRGGKSGLHGDTVPDNVRRGRPQGKCHRKQTACPVRRAGKGETVGQEPTARPATEAARQTPPGARPNRGGTPGNRQRCFRVVARVGRARRSVTDVPEEWPSPASRRGQNPAYRPSDPHCLVRLIGVSPT